MADLLVAENIGKTFFSSGSAPQVRALDKVTLNISSGEFLCVLGMTGCGKTTLLRILAGLENPTEGRLFLNGQEAVGVNRASTLVFQQYSLFPWMTVEENVAFPLQARGMNKREGLVKAREFLELVGLSGCLSTYPYDLSGGMQQRVAIARALAYDPQILLMDEPFGALDERMRRQLQVLLLDIWSKKKKTVVFVTHNIDEAITMADRIIVMAGDSGCIIDDVKVDLPRPRNRLDEKFINILLGLRNRFEDMGK